MIDFISDFCDWFNVNLTFSHATAGTLSHGIYAPGEPEETTVAGCLQPSSRQLTMEEYGFEVEADYNFYCYDSTPIVGDTTEYNGETYIVATAKDWNDYRILALKKVQTDV